MLRLSGLVRCVCSPGDENQPSLLNIYFNVYYSISSILFLLFHILYDDQMNFVAMILFAWLNFVKLINWHHLIRYMSNVLKMQDWKFDKHFDSIGLFIFQ